MISQSWIMRFFLGFFVLMTAGIANVGQSAMTNLILSDEPGGVTCRNVFLAGNMAWNRRGGDWFDANHVLHGNHPYVETSFSVQKGNQVVQWDVTKLVKEWISGSVPNTGFMLRAIPRPGLPNGIASFYSREADETMHPILKIEWVNHLPSFLSPLSDMHLDCSTHRSLGKSPSMQVGNDYSSILVFPVSVDLSKQVKSAVLTLISHKQYGSGANVGVFRAAPPWALPESAEQSGIADRYPEDKNIDQDVDVILIEDFESWDWLSASVGENTSRVEQDEERLFFPLVGKALKVTLTPESNAGLNLHYRFQEKTGREPEEVYFRYYLRFGNDWDPLEGGKMPGFSGTYSQAGWGGRKSNGENGWSLRGAFSRRFEQFTPMGTYAYHA